MKKIFAAALLLGAMTACGGAKESRELEGTTWKLVSMKGIPASAIESEEDAFTLTFDPTEHLLAGRTNCNRFFGSYRLDEERLTLGEMGMTRMACPDMEYEDVFVRMFDRVDAYRIDGERLTLLDGSETLAEFAAAGTPADK